MLNLNCKWRKTVLKLETTEFRSILRLLMPISMLERTQHSAAKVLFRLPMAAVPTQDFAKDILSCQSRKGCEGLHRPHPD